MSRFGTPEQGDHFGPRANTIVDRSSPERPTRVCEAWNPPPTVPVADLALTEQQLPEVLTALRWADEVHFHGADMLAGLHMLPYVSPDALTGKRLVIHGPCVAPAPVGTDATRLKEWPGPVEYDTLAGGRNERAANLATDRIWLDPAAAELLPSATAGPEGPVPFSGEGRRAVVLTLAAQLPEALKHRLVERLGRLDVPQLDIEVWDEAQLARAIRPRTRRHAHGCIAAATDGTAVLGEGTACEAMLQAIPLILLGARPSSAEQAPPGVRWIDGSEMVDACIAVLEDWIAAWTRGEPAPVDVASARDWALSHCD